MMGAAPLDTVFATPPTDTARAETPKAFMPRTRLKLLPWERFRITSIQHGDSAAVLQSFVLSVPDWLPPGAYFPLTGGMLTVTSDDAKPLAAAESSTVWTISALRPPFACLIAPASAAVSATFCWLRDWL